MKRSSALKRGNTGIAVSVSRAAIFGALAGFMLAMPAGPADAGNKLYDMNRLLNEPNPFDTSAPHSGLPVVSTEVAQAGPGSPQLRIPASPEPALPDLDYDPSSLPGADAIDGRDPLEPVNRAIFAFNEVFYQYLLSPVARAYNAVVPQPVRTALSNTLSNLNEPVNMANGLLQGDLARGLNSGGRFIVNSTFGLLGTIDVASKMGIHKSSEDFGQTLAVWGVGEGLYLVIPLLGPSNPRDALGTFLVDGYFDPLGYYLENTDQEEYGYVRSGVSGLTTYARIVDDLDDLRETSIDFYGALRSLYRQRRLAEIRNNEQGTVPSLGGL